MIILRTTLIIFIVLLTGCNQEDEGDMLRPFLDKPKEKTYVIASPLDGVLMKDGVPLSDKKIIRRLYWNNNEEGVETVVFTDSKGRFSFPLHEDTFNLKNVLIEFVARQRVLVEDDGVLISIWGSGQSTGLLFAESGGEELTNITCDLNNESVQVDTANLFVTKCRWDGFRKESL